MHFLACCASRIRIFRGEKFQIAPAEIAQKESTHACIYNVGERHNSTSKMFTFHCPGFLKQAPVDWWPKGNNV